MIRRYAPLKPSRGTVIPWNVRKAVLDRDAVCVGRIVGMPGDCFGERQLDHVRASHGMGMKSESTAANLVSLCASHHKIRTESGRTWRPLLLRYLEAVR